jgi:hypothetical protein
MRLGTAVTGLIIVLGGMVPGAAASRTISESYAGSFDPLTFGMCKADGAPENIGLVCIPLKGTDDSLDIRSEDTVFGTAGLFYLFRDASGGCVGESDDPAAACPNADFVCGSQVNLKKPGGAVGIDIYPLTFLGTVNCTGLEGSDTLGFSTVGTIRVTIRS